MTIQSIVAGFVQLLGLALAPLLLGFVAQLKAVLQGRRGPGPLQPYRELRRLWGKSAVQPDSTGPIYRVVPSIVAASLMLVFLLVPVAGASASWGLGNDVLVVVGLFALARFATALAAWDTGTGFALMGASRDLTIGVFADGLLILVLLLVAIGAGDSTDLLAMADASLGADSWAQPIHWCAGIAFVLVAIAETGRQPVDNPDTHLELTMIHEGPLLEYAGRDLAVLQWSGAARLWLMTLLAAALFAPATGSFAARLGELVLVIVLLGAGLAVTETAVAKMRILRIPLLLGGGAVICMIGLTSHLIGGFS